jgi:hypothetical protein
MPPSRLAISRPTLALATRSVSGARVILAQPDL